MKVELQRKGLQQAEPIQSKRKSVRLSFKDNRPEATSQTKLISIIQNCKEGCTIQREGIDPSKLNVAGENHDESNSRRGNEVEFCKEKMKNENYWLEDKFKKADGSLADPQRLMLDQALAFLVEYKEQAFIDMGFIEIVYGLNRKINAYTIAQELGLTYNMDLFMNYREVFNSIITDIANLAKIPFSLANSKMSDQLKEAIDNIVTKRKRIPQYISPAMGFPAMTVRRLRSRSMRNAANSGDITGVWKIGQDHVDDIISEEPIYNLIFGTPKYNLIPLDNFNKEYNDWETSKKTNPSS